MNKIVSKEYFSANVIKFEVEAPLIAKSRKAGHFVMVKVGLNGLAFEKCLKPLYNPTDFETQQIIHLQEIKHNLLITHED